AEDGIRYSSVTGVQTCALLLERDFDRFKRELPRALAGRLAPGPCPGRKAGQAELGGRHLPAEHQLRDQLPHGRPVFKAVPGAAAHEPDVRRRWVTVDDEVLVGRVFVLAHPGLDQRSAL